jgi:predicted TIM-barrel fold metal-dependent hydrolase
MRAIDCDVHCAPESIDALAPYLSDYWRHYIEEAGIPLHGLVTAYPPGAPTTGSAPPGSYASLKHGLLDDAEPSHVVLNCLTALEAHRNPYYAAALATAVNDWVADEFLDRDDRLRASIAVSSVSPEDAVAEIERRGEDPRFVQVLLPVRSDIPWAHKNNHAIFAAAAQRGLPIGLHAWGRPGSAPTPSGFTTTYLEQYVANQAVAQAQLISFVCEGVFERFPELRVVLIECGFAWLAPLLWRFDKDWKGIWREVPWVKQRPSEYVYRHVRASTAPSHVPADEQTVSRLLEMIDAQTFLTYGSDYPHVHGPGPEALLEQMSPDGREAVLHGNAAALYGLTDG